MANTQLTNEWTGGYRPLHRSVIPDLQNPFFTGMVRAVSFNPPLTAVAQPTRDLGRTAAKLLLDRFENPERPIRKVILQPQLKVRASCGSILYNSNNTAR